MARISTALVWSIVAGAVAVVGAQPTTTGPFTAAQVAAGRESFATYCASCHPLDVGLDATSSLVGEDFMLHWRNRTTTDLFQYIQKSMPPTSPGDAGFEVDLGIIAFMLERNGATAGRAPLTSTTEVRIGSVAGGRLSRARPASSPK